jgi:hypothetical protein
MICFNFSFLRLIFSRFFFFFISSFCEQPNRSFLAEFGIDLSSLIKLKNIPPDVRRRLPFYNRNIWITFLSRLQVFETSVN